MNSLSETAVATGGNTFDYSSMKRMIEKIGMLGESEQYQIFNIIRENKQKYTENQNGIFINFNQLNSGTLQTINQYVNFFEKQKQSFENHNKLLESMETLINNKVGGLSTAGGASTPLSQFDDEMMGTSTSNTQSISLNTTYIDDLNSGSSEMTMNYLSAASESIMGIKDLDDAEKEISGLIQKNSRKKDLTLNKTKPYYSGSSARIAKKCNYLEGASTSGPN